LFTDDIKVVKHGLEAAFGSGAEVHHALNSEGKTAHLTAKAILKALQLQGPLEILLRRHLQQTDSPRRKRAFNAFPSQLISGIC